MEETPNFDVLTCSQGSDLGQEQLNEIEQKAQAKSTKKATPRSARAPMMLLGPQINNMPSKSLVIVLFIHEIVSFHMVFLGIVFKARLKYPEELLTIMLKIQKLTL